MSNQISEFSREALEALDHETPCFVFSQKKIIDNYERFKKCFPRAIIRYAMKANSEPEILKLMHEAGAGFECASVFEMHMLQKIGVPGDKVIYGNAVKAAQHIKEAYEYGVRVFAFDSLHELEKIASVAPDAKVYARMLVNDAGSVFKFSEKFGTDVNNIAPLLMRAKELGLTPYGVSFHVGSQASNINAWATAIEDLKDTLIELKKNDIEIEVLNIGGGFPCNTYASSEETFTLEDIAEVTLEKYEQLPYQPTILIESGRGMIADTGVVIGTVIARIERKEHTWLFLDVGPYSALFESMAYQGSTRYRMTSMRKSFDSGEASFAVCGPTSDSQDVITREALLPADMDIGDKVIFHDTGAYNTTAYTPFNAFPKPHVYFV